MGYSFSIPDYIQSIQPYVPGKPLEELEREYGIRDSIKLASNENPLGPSPKAIEAIQKHLMKLNRYPEGSGYLLVNKLANRLGVSPQNVVLGNGSDEVIGMLTRVLLTPGDEAIMPKPSFLMYEIMVRCDGGIPVFVPLKSLSIDLDETLNYITSKTKIIFLTNPNNPTGTIICKNDFERFLKSVPREIVVVMDEAYIEFVRSPDCAIGLEYLNSDRTIVVLRTFSKVYGLAGLRIGFGVMPESLASILHRIRAPFNTSILAQAGALAALDDTEFITQTLKTVHEGIEYFARELTQLNIPYFPTQANFFLIDVGRNANDVFEALLRQGVIVRSMISYGYPNYIRITVGTQKENERLIHALKTVLK